MDVIIVMPGAHSSNKYIAQYKKVPYKFTVMFELHTENVSL